MVPVDQTIRSAIASVALLRECWQSGVAYNPFLARVAPAPYSKSYDNLSPIVRGRCTVMAGA